MDGRSTKRRCEVNERNHGQGIPWTRAKEWYEDTGWVAGFWAWSVAMGALLGVLIGIASR